MYAPIASRSPKPRNRIVPGPEFVYPCPAWLEREPQTWEDVANKPEQSPIELFRLVRSIAFLADPVPPESSVQVIISVLETSMPALDAANYLKFEGALAALFEPLAPWTAAVILESWEDFEWDYCRWKGIGQYLDLLMPEFQRNLPEDTIRVLELFFETAKSNLEGLDRRAQHHAIVRGMLRGRQQSTPPRGKLARIRDLFSRKQKATDAANIAGAGNVVIFNSERIAPISA